MIALLPNTVIVCSREGWPATPKITWAQLRKLGVCKNALADFKRLFGSEVWVTEALAVEHAAVFSWDYAAQYLLSTAQRDAYDTTVRPHQDAYKTALESLLGGGFHIVLRIHEGTVNAIRATTFARLYIEQETV